MDLSNYQSQWVSIEHINVENRTFQFRKDITPESVWALAESLKDDGQKIPVIIWGRASGELQLICGYRRVEAAKQLSWEKILSVIIPEADMNETEALRYNFIENIERKTLSNLDMMFACKKLKDSGKTNEEIGKLIGKSEGQIRRYIKVVDAPADIQQKVQVGEATINDVAKGSNRSGYDSASQCSNMYVKPIKNGFDAVLKFRKGRDNADTVNAFIGELKKALKEAQKKQSAISGQSSDKSTQLKAESRKLMAGFGDIPDLMTDSISEALANFENLPENVKNILKKQNPELFQRLKDLQEGKGKN